MIPFGPHATLVPGETYSRVWEGWGSRTRKHSRSAVQPNESKDISTSLCHVSVQCVGGEAKASSMIVIT